MSSRRFTLAFRVELHSEKRDDSEALPRSSLSAYVMLRGMVMDDAGLVGYAAAGFDMFRGGMAGDARALKKVAKRIPGLKCDFIFLIVYHRNKQTMKGTVNE